MNETGFISTYYTSFLEYYKYNSDTQIVYRVIRTLMKIYGRSLNIFIIVITIIVLLYL